MFPTSNTVMISKLVIETGVGGLSMRGRGVK